MKYIKLYLLTLKMNLMDMAIFRGNFIVWALVHSSSLVINLIFFQVIYSQIKSLNGWNLYQVLIVMGVNAIITGLGSATFFPFLWGFGRKIRTGDFDVSLVKPADIQFLSAFTWIDLEDVILVPLGLAIVVYGLNGLGAWPGPLNITLFILLIVNTMIILFSLASLLLSMAFKFVRVDSAIYFFWSVINISRYPTKAITNVPVLVIAFLVPLAILTSVPAEVIFGRNQWSWIAGAFVLGISLFFLSRWVFLQSVKNYSSASS